ncbi:hypothetical protein BVX97_02180 [bacterium E08(2017)]|nr:hypothetical protein BVX97_02180 [bacterium E08(2017)]
MAIDDESAILQCLQKALSSHGYEVETCNDPIEGSEKLVSDDSIVLALLDVKMPKKNGFEIYRDIRNTRKIPVLFVTAYPRSFDAESDSVIQMWQEEFADGTTDIIYKPFNLESLYEKVEGLIGPAVEPDEVGE